jgi:uncharacterized protein
MYTTLLSRLSQAIVRDGASGLASLMTDDAVLELPLVAPPVRVAGRAAITDFLGRAAHAPRLRFTEHRLVALHASDDSDELVAEFELHGTARGTDQPFCLPSIAVLRERAGQIALYRDYFNPALVARAASAQPKLVIERLRHAIARKDMDAFAGLFANDRRARVRVRGAWASSAPRRPRSDPRVPDCLVSPGTDRYSGSTSSRA